MIKHATVISMRPRRGQFFLAPLEAARSSPKVPAVATSKPKSDADAACRRLQTAFKNVAVVHSELTNQIHGHNTNFPQDFKHYTIKHPNNICEIMDAAVAISIQNMDPAESRIRMHSVCILAKKRADFPYLVFRS